MYPFVCRAVRCRVVPSKPRETTLGAPSDRAVGCVIAKKQLEVLKKPLPLQDGFHALDVSVRKDIKDKLEKIAYNEGRPVDEIFREAIAKLIRDRGY